MSEQPLVIKQEYKAPVALVWKCISDKELMKKWYFDIPDFQLQIGAIFHFEGGKEGRRYIHECEIVEIVPLKKLKYSWKYQGYTGLSFVTFELFDQGDTTLLKLTHEGLHSFPRDNPDFVRDNFVGGWNYLIHESLQEYLEKGKALRTW